MLSLLEALARAKGGTGLSSHSGDRLSDCARQ